MILLIIAVLLLALVIVGIAVLGALKHGFDQHLRAMESLDRRLMLLAEQRKGEVPPRDRNPS